MDYWEISKQHVRKISEASNETMGSYVFKTNDFCMITGCENNEVGQSSRTVINIFEGGDVISKGMKEKKNHSYVVKRHEITLSHKSSHGEYYTQLVNNIVKEVDDDDESLMKCSYQHKEMIPKDTQESHGFKFNQWCVYAGYEDDQEKSEEVEKKHSRCHAQRL
jgi:hypothetical protein